MSHLRPTFKALTPLEVLDLPLVPDRRGARRERTEIPATPRLRVDLARVDPEPARGESSDHEATVGAASAAIRGPAASDPDRAASGPASAKAPAASAGFPWAGAARGA